MAYQRPRTTRNPKRSKARQNRRNRLHARGFVLLAVALQCLAFCLTFTFHFFMHHENPILWIIPIMLYLVSAMSVGAARATWPKGRLWLTETILIGELLVAWTFICLAIGWLGQFPPKAWAVGLVIVAPVAWGHGRAYFPQS